MSPVPPDDNSPKRQRVQKGQHAGIAKILQGDGPDHSGMGILVDPHHVVTCAHVVNDAISERKVDDLDRPSASVQVVFPMVDHPAPIVAEIIEWRGPGDRPQDDIAVLRLTKPAPNAAGLAMLADIQGMSLDGDSLSIFGVAEGERLGSHIDARFKGPTSAAWVQLDRASRDTGHIDHGFSGAAVWDRTHDAVVGMVVAKKLSEQDVAYMISAADLHQLWPALPMEERQHSAAFARTWSILSAIFFLALFAHLAVDRGIKTLSPLTLSGDHKALANFWGMHVYAFIAPFLLWSLAIFAKSFRMHEWFARVPSFGALARPTPSSSSLTATASLFLLVALPLTAQLHFIQQFNDSGRGSVYVYPGSFGYQTGELVAKGERCATDRSLHLCTMQDAGRLARATPKPGSEAGYWVNAYHFGNVDEGDGGTVTFFPILQPVVIYLLTILSIVLGVWALVRILQRKPTAQESGATHAGAPPPPKIDPA